MGEDVTVATDRGANNREARGRGDHPPATSPIRTPECPGGGTWVGGKRWQSTDPTSMTESRAELRLDTIIGWILFGTAVTLGEHEMPVTKLLRPALAATLLVSATACGASPVPDTPASVTTDSEASEARGSADPMPVTAVMPDVIGGNAGRAFEQMSSELDMVFKDASGQGRAVDDPAAWRICDSRPGPNQQITEYPVVFEVLKVSESCEDATPK
ncbi:hypothetical protein ABZ281_12605 [Streptomyces sp. NPDC006265]|uniref:hypothetical protein n=1 Tax=Streptomyces sp. NPDC006265 TaxID=3156740 RepID=UPI0033AC157A